MKVYVITWGDYSDYSIDKVFLDKAKAEEYAAIYKGDKRVEEYDVYEGDIKGIAVIHANAKFDNFTRSMFDYQHYIRGMMSDEFEGENTAYKKDGYLYINRGTPPHKYIAISRIISQVDYNEHHEYAKYMKVLQDIHKQILLLESQGLTEQEINELLKTG